MPTEPHATGSRAAIPPPPPPPPPGLGLPETNMRPHLWIEPVVLLILAVVIIGSRYA